MPNLPIVSARSDDEPGAARPVPIAPAAAGSRTDLDEDDLEGVLEMFYRVVVHDPLLAVYFENVDMRTHMPRIVDFWSTLVFHTGRYTGNAFRVHLDMPGLTAGHFARWLATLEGVVDSAHAGPNAERMKALAHRVAFSMQLRLGIAPGSG